MKILYAIQGTGNGHISRAIEIIPHLKSRAEVDILISGISSDISLPFEVKYRFHGWSYIFGQSGGIDFLSTFRKTKLLRLFREIRHLPVENYDLILNDFEPIAAWACWLRNKKCVGLSNQAAITLGLLPKPKKWDPIGHLILKYYAPCTKYYGFHFYPLGRKFYPPVIRKEVRELKTSNDGHYTVYLPAHSEDKIISFLKNFKSVKWEVFSKHNKIPLEYGSISIKPISGSAFMQSLASCEGVLCASGFATTSETLYLKKKLMVVPMKNQIEQLYNAKALEGMGVKVLRSLRQAEVKKVSRWLKSKRIVEVNYTDETEKMVQQILRHEYAAEDNYVNYISQGQFQYSPS